MPKYLTDLDVNASVDISGDLAIGGQLSHGDGIDLERWGRTYVVNVNSPLPLLTNDGSNLPTGGGYRMTGHISGTGTEQVSVAVFWNENGTWYVNKTFEGGTSSNHVEFKILNSVPTVTLETHEEDYSVRVQHERIALGEGSGDDNLRGYFGADSYLSWLESTNTLTVPGKISGAEIEGTSLDINGAADISGTTDISGALFVGADGAGHDVKFFGTTSGKYMLWNESANALLISGEVGIGDTSPDSKLKVASVATDDSLYTVDIQHTRTNANVGTHAIRVNMDLSGSDSTTADRISSGILLDIDSEADGDASDEHRIYGVNSDVRFSGYSDLVRSGYFYAESNNSTEKTAQLIGVMGYAAHDSNSIAGGVTSMYGSYGLSAIQDLGDVDNTWGGYFKAVVGTNRGDADVGVMYGVEARIEITKAETINYGTMTGVKSVIDNNVGTAPAFGSQYLFKGDYQGTKGSNAWGIYTEGDKNYFEGDVGIGTASPAEKLHVNGGHLEVQNSGNTNIYINAAVGSDSTLWFQEGGSAKGKIQNDASNDSILISDGANADTMTLKGQKVGIGTTTPSEVLDVVGNIAASGGTFGGNVNIAGNLYANRYFQTATGIPTNNLGDPTVSEMALFEEQFGPKTTLANGYDDLADLKFFTRATGTTEGDYTEVTTYTDDQKRKFLRTNNSPVVIDNTHNSFRVEFVGKGYTFANAMYAYWSSQSHNTQVHVWKRRCSDDVWVQHTSSSTTISSWPGHAYLPFATIPWYETNTTSATHYSRVRIEFTPNWVPFSGTVGVDTDYSARDIILYGMQIWGGYPTGRRTPHQYDQNGKLNLFGDIDVPGNMSVDGTVDGIDIATRDALLTTTNDWGDHGAAGYATTSYADTAETDAIATAATASEAYTDAAIVTLVDSAPGALDTLNELATALGDDANFSTTVTNSIATKLPLAGGTMSGAIAMGSNNITGGGAITGTTLTGSSLDINGAADISGNLTIGPNATAGGRILSQHYSGANRLGVISSNSSSGNLVLGYGAEGKVGDSGDANVFVSTYGNFNGGHSALQMSGTGLKWYADASNSQTTIGSDLTLANVFSVSRAGNATFAGTLDVAGDITLGSRFNLGDDGVMTWGNSNDYGQLSWDGDYALISGLGSKGIKFRTNGTSDALTLDTSQNATFEGTIGSGAITSTGLITGTSLDINGNADISGAVSIGSTLASNEYSLVTIQGRKSHMFSFTGSQDHTLTLNSGAYYQAEVTITAHQTNAGTYNNIYIRGIWSNNHQTHHWDELERVGALTGGTIAITNGQNGSTAASGQLAIVHDDTQGDSFAGMTVNVIEHYGTSTHVIS